MPIPSVDLVSHRVRLPAVLTRGRDSRTTLETRLGDSLVAPSSGTYTLTSPTGATVYTGSITVTGSIAVATVPASSLPSTLALGDGYREVWTLTYSGVPQAQDATRPAIVARYAVHCPVTQADLHNEYPDLASMMNATPTSLQGFVDVAWEDVVRRLLSEGKWPEQIVDVETLVQPVRELALSKFFRYFSLTSASERHAALSDSHASAYRSAWSEVRYRIDADGNGSADSTQRVSAVGVIRMNAPAPYEYQTSGRRRVL